MKQSSTTADMPSPAPVQAEVRTAQEKLRDNGYEPGPIDGIWGPRTAAAVSQYQRKEKMTVTNRLDPETLGKLDGAPRRPQSP
jgi:peptidoglycan hydrolase-like protein with peptidoglycan-binding domain